MDTHAKQNCIDALERVLDVYEGQLDTRVIAEINVVIAALKDESSYDPESGISDEWSVRALKVIGEVVRIVTDIANLMN